MPYSTSTSTEECDGVAVVKDASGEVMGCHDTEEEAQAQIAAIEASEGSRLAKEDIDTTPTEAMQEAARRGLEMHEEGKSGDGLEGATVREAKSMAAGEALTEAKVRKGNAFWGRNEDYCNDGASDAQITSRLLWGGCRSKDWFDRKHEQFEEAEADGRMTSTTEQRSAIMDRAKHTSGMMATSEPEEGAFSTGIWRANARDARDQETTTILVATEEIARDGMILRMDGVDTSSYMENPVVLWMHGQDPVRGSLPIARCINIMRRPEGLLAQLEWYKDDFSQTIREMMREKYLNAASIGWNTPEGGITFEEINGRRVPVVERSDMTEFSIVAVPADAQALVQSRANGERADDGEMQGMDEMQRAYKRMYDDVRAYCMERMDEEEMEGRGMLDMMRMYMEGELDLSGRMQDSEQEDDRSERSDTSDPATAGSPSNASDPDATASGSDANDRDEEIVEVYEVESVDDLVATINQIVDRGLGRA